MKTVQENVAGIEARVQATLKRIGREGEKVVVVYVTKKVPVERIQQGYDFGLRVFGENRVQEFLEKKDDLPPGVCWHMIGHLQTNKVKTLLGHVELIQSLDRPELANEITKQAKKRQIDRVNCLIQVNSSGEASKFGFEFDKVEPWLAGLPIDSPIHIQGLMTIGPQSQDADATREAFSRTRALRNALQAKFSRHDWHFLSMGMSGDFEIALEEGSNMIRLGTAIFGARDK